MAYSTTAPAPVRKPIPRVGQLPPTASIPEPIPTAEVPRARPLPFTASIPEPVPTAEVGAPRRPDNPVGQMASGEPRTPVARMGSIEPPPPGGYNNPANAPQNDPDGLPPRPARGTSFGAGKAQGGTGPASVTTPITDGIAQTPPVGSTTSSATVPPPTPARRPTIQPFTPPVVNRPRLPMVGGPPPGDPSTDPRYVTINPADSSRLSGIRSAADRAATDAAGFDATAAAGAGADDATRRLATPDVGFQGVNTQVTRRSVNPTVDFQGMNTDVARRAVDPNVGFQGVETDVGVGPSVDPTVSADLAAFRQKQMEAAKKLTDGPSRAQLAQTNLDAFDARAEPQIRDKLRAVGQRAARDGRLGMGATTIEMLNPMTDYLRERATLSKELASETAGQEIADRQNTLQATRGLVGDQFGQDAGMRSEQRTERSNVQDITGQNLARRTGERNTKLSLDVGNKERDIAESAADYGANAANMSRRIGERDTGLGVAERNVGRAMDESNADVSVATGNVNRGMAERDAGTANAQTNAARQLEIRRAALAAGLSQAELAGATKRAGASLLAGREDQVGTQEERARGELRGERQNQQDLSRQATEDAVRQYLLEQGAEDTDFNRQMAIAQLAQGGNPAGALAGGANTAAGQSSDAYAALAELLKQRYATTVPQ